MAGGRPIREVSRGLRGRGPNPNEKHARARRVGPNGRIPRPTTTHLLDQSVHLLVGDELLLRQSGDQAIVVRHGHARDAALRGSRVGMCVRRQTTNGFGLLLLLAPFASEAPAGMSHSTCRFFFIVRHSYARGRAPSSTPRDPVARRRLKRQNNSTETAGRSIARAVLRITRYGSSSLGAVDRRLSRRLRVSQRLSRRRRRRGRARSPPPPPRRRPRSAPA